MLILTNKYLFACSGTAYNACNCLETRSNLLTNGRMISTHYRIQHFKQDKGELRSTACARAPGYPVRPHSLIIKDCHVSTLFSVEISET